MIARTLYALVAADYSMLGLLFAGSILAGWWMYNQKVATSVLAYAVFRGLLAPTMILAHLLYLWPMRFDTATADKLTSQMGGGDRNAGATVYTVLYQWLCNGLLPAVLHLGMHVMLWAYRDDEAKRTYPFRIELISQALFAAVVFARFLAVFLSVFSVKLVWFYLAWSDPWPTIASNRFTNSPILVPLFWVFVWFVYPKTRITRADIVTLCRILRDAKEETAHNITTIRTFLRL